MYKVCVLTNTAESNVIYCQWLKIILVLTQKNTISKDTDS